MAKKVKCQVTKEYGTNETFYKADNGKYYKSKEVYDSFMLEKKKRKELINYIVNDVLEYQEGQVYPTLIIKKLKELEFYDDEVILKTFEKCKDSISYQLNIDGKFDNDNSKIFYIFAVIKNNINDVHKNFIRNQKINRSMKSKEKNNELDVLNNIDVTNDKGNTSGTKESNDFIKLHKTSSIEAFL